MIDKSPMGNSFIAAYTGPAVCVQVDVNGPVLVERREFLVVAQVRSSRVGLHDVVGEDLLEENRVADDVVEDLLGQGLPRLVIRCEHGPRSLNENFGSWAHEGGYERETCCLQKRIYIQLDHLGELECPSNGSVLAELKKSTLPNSAERL